jgi:hypothetical protein
MPPYNFLVQNYLKQIILHKYFFLHKPISESNRNEIEENIFALCAGFVDNLKPLHGLPRALRITG